MPDKNVLTKQEILNVTDFAVQEVTVPEWGGMVRLKSLSGKERDLFEARIGAQSVGNKVDLKGLRAFLLAMCMVDEKNELLFTVKDVEALNSKSARALNALFEVAQTMNGIGEEAVKELLGNSEGNLKDAGGSGSPDSSAAGQ